MLPFQGAMWNVVLFPKALPLGWGMLLFQSDLENPANRSEAELNEVNL